MIITALPTCDRQHAPRTLELREESLPLDALVVLRLTGDLTHERLAAQAHRTHAARGVLALSALVTRGTAANLQALLADHPHPAGTDGLIALAWSYTLREQGGLVVLPTMAAPHCDVLLPSVSAVSFRRLVDCFTPPQAADALTPPAWIAPERITRSEWEA